MVPRTHNSEHMAALVLSSTYLLNEIEDLWKLILRPDAAPYSFRICFIVLASEHVARKNRKQSLAKKQVGYRRSITSYATTSMDKGPIFTGYEIALRASTQIINRYGKITLSNPILNITLSKKTHSTRTQGRPLLYTALGYFFWALFYIYI